VNKNVTPFYLKYRLNPLFQDTVFSYLANIAIIHKLVSLNTNTKSIIILSVTLQSLFIKYF